MKTKKRVDVGGIFFMVALSLIFCGMFFTCVAVVLEFGQSWLLAMTLLGFGILVIWGLVFYTYLESGIFTEDHDVQEHYM